MTKKVQLFYQGKPWNPACGKCGVTPASPTPYGFHSFLCEKHLKELLETMK